MAKTVTIDQMAEEISRTLSEWSQDVSDSMKEAVTETAKETVQDLRATSPHRTGNYAKSWGRKSTFEDRFRNEEVVYNRKYYRLTHLLEFGHANARGGGRTPAHPHIAPAEERAIEALEKKVRKGIDDVS